MTCVLYVCMMTCVLYVCMGNVCVVVCVYGDVCVVWQPVDEGAESGDSSPALDAGETSISKKLYGIYLSYMCICIWYVRIRFSLSTLAAERGVVYSSLYVECNIYSFIMCV
jgi:hypothetical protein